VLDLMIDHIIKIPFRSKQKWLFWRTGFFPANQGFLKTFQIALMGWIKAKAIFVLIV